MALALFPWQQELAAELNALRGQLPNGILVYGPRASELLILCMRGQNLLCTSPATDGTPCGRCKGCHLVEAMTHPDIRYVVSEAEALPRGLPFVAPDNASANRKNLYREILIHQPRALADFLNLKSHEGGVRVVVVYPADQIRAEAAASLLKSLEEPPEQTIFVLVADEIDRVLPTIRSRCRLIRALPPSHAQALSWLQSQGETDAELKLADAGGMPLSVFETDQRLVLVDDARDKLLQVLSEGAQTTAEHIIAAVGRDVALPAAAMLLSRWAWDIAAARQGVPVRYFPSHAHIIADIAAKTDASKLYAWINSVRDVRRLGDHPVAGKLALEALLIAYQRALR